jgi:hypothetical protein
MEPVSTLGLIASVVTTLSGLGWIMERSNRRIETIINHMEKVEVILNELRADLPVKYTMKDEHIRLVEKVDKIEGHIYQWGRKAYVEHE